MSKDEFYIQAYTAEEFYTIYDEPTGDFKEVVQADRDYFHSTSDLYDDIRKDSKAMHIVAFSTDTNKAFSHVGVCSLSTDTDTTLYISFTSSH